MKKLLTTILTLCFACAATFAQQNKSQTVLKLDDGNYYIHTVAAGETLYSLSKLYNLESTEVIANNNPQIEGVLKSGQVIKIPCQTISGEKMSRRQYNRTFSEHTIGPGETVYSIARRYGLSVEVLFEDNPGIDPSKLSIGKALNIRKSEIGESSSGRITDQINQYKQAMNSLSDSYEYHLVSMGETIYSLSRMFEVSEEEIRANNDLSHGLKSGMIIKIPSKKGTHSSSAETIVFPSSVVDQTEPTILPANHLRNGNLTVSLLLPLTGTNSSRTHFIEFYQGVLLGFEDLKSRGYSATLHLYDTENSKDVVEDIVKDLNFRNSDLIIGPVYENNLREVADYALINRVPIVSPLAALTDQYAGTVYQLSPASDRKNEKLKEFFTNDANIILITADKKDSEMEQEMKQLAGMRPYKQLSYHSKLSATEVDNLLSATNDNLFIVTASDEVAVDKILATISSVHNNRKAKSITTAPVKVIGNSKWSRYRNLDKDLFFKLEVAYVTTYYADRSNETVNKFEKRYLNAFRSFPTLYSYRGYDTAVLFTEAMVRSGSDLTFNLNTAHKASLQVPYFFERNGSNWVNTEWVLVNYRNDYTITVK